MDLKTAKNHHQTLLKEWELLVKGKGIDLSDTETNNLNTRLSNTKKNLEHLKKNSMENPQKCANNECKFRADCERAQLTKLIEPYQWFDSSQQNCFSKRKDIKYKLPYEKKTALEVNTENYLAEIDKKFQKVIENAQYRIVHELAVAKAYYFRLYVNKVAEFSERYVYDYCDRHNTSIEALLQVNIE